MYKGKYKAIIFDLDGTLLDTLEDIGDSMNLVLKNMNFPVHEIDKYRYYVGSGVRELAIRALPENQGDETINECINEFRNIYKDNWNVKSRPYQGIQDMLEEVFAKGLKVAILSNKPDDFTKLCVNEFLPAWKFNNVVGLNSRIPPKPDPTGALEIAERLRIKPSHFIYVGDTSIDMQTAVTAGMFPVGVTWGFRSKKELLENGANALLSNPMDLINLLI